MQNKDALGFYQNIAKKYKKAGQEKFLPSNDNSHIDAEFIKNYCHPHTRLLDMGTGSGLIISRLVSHVDSIVAVEKFAKFASFIPSHPSIEVVIADILEYQPSQSFDLVTLFGIANYFNTQEITHIYQVIYQCLKPAGRLIVKNQFGVSEDVVVDGYSAEIKHHYYAYYRHLDNEITLLKKIGYQTIETHDIYPAAKNKWDNTHYYALVCYK